MNEIKDVQLKARFTKAESERIKEFAQAHDITVSDLIRLGLQKIMLEKGE